MRGWWDGGKEGVIGWVWHLRDVLRVEEDGQGGCGEGGEDWEEGRVV